MDRDSFPTLLASLSGWPVMAVPWSGGRSVLVSVVEDHETGGAVVQVQPGSVPVRVEVLGA